MSGDWIKMRCNLWDDPRVSRIVDMTDSSEASVVGALYWLWATADQHSQDGFMPGLSLRQIDRKTGIPGVGAAIASVGWASESPEGVTLERFEEHNGASAKKRCQTAKRVADHRSGNADVTQQALPNQNSSVNTALAREEKRREEKEIPSEANASGAEAPPPSSVDEIFGRGLPALIAAGCPEKNARSMLGLMRKTHGDDALIQALADMAKERPLEPVAWLQAALRPKAKPAGSHTGFALKNYRDGVTEDGSIAA